MHVLEILKTSNGKILVSIILAVGLSCILQMSFNNANIVIINGPEIEQTYNKIFSFDNKCYSYKTVTANCNNLENNKEHI